MTLRQFLAALSTNKGMSVTLINVDTELLTFNIEGYQAVESDILDMGVSTVIVNKTPANIAMKITLTTITD